VKNVASIYLATASNNGWAVVKAVVYFWKP